MANDEADIVASKLKNFTESDEASDDAVRYYLTEILRIWERHEQQLTRIFVTMLALAAVFELSSRQLLAEVSLGPVKLAGIAFIPSLCPLLIALLYMRATSIKAQSTAVRAVHYSLYKSTYPRADEAGLSTLLAPSSTSFAPEFYESYSRPGTGRWLRLLMLNAEILAIIVLPLAFLIYAQWRLVGIHGAAEYWLWLLFGIELSLYLIATLILWFDTDT